MSLIIDVTITPTTIDHYFLSLPPQTTTYVITDHHYLQPPPPKTIPNPYHQRHYRPALHGRLHQPPPSTNASTDNPSPNIFDHPFFTIILNYRQQHRTLSLTIPPEKLLKHLGKKCGFILIV